MSQDPNERITVRRLVIQVVNLETGEVVKEIVPRSESEGYLQKLELGLLRNMNTEKYGVKRGASCADH